MGRSEGDGDVGGSEGEGHRGTGNEGEGHMGTGNEGEEDVESGKEEEGCVERGLKREYGGKEDTKWEMREKIEKGK